jgi:predicted small metal-binding protein
MYKQGYACGSKGYFGYSTKAHTRRQVVSVVKKMPNHRKDAHNLNKIRWE